MPELTFKITNLNCEACIKISTKALSAIPGVTNAQVDLTTGQAQITSTEAIDPQTIVATLKAKDFEVEL